MMRARRTFWRWTLAVTLPLVFKAGLGCAEVAGIHLPASDTCRNGEKDKGEKGIDCGGPCVGTCPGEPCSDGHDCASGTCDEVCLDPRCNDGIWNGVELNEDVCPFGPPGMCEEGRCYPAPCFDNVKNGRETDVDCGGEDCRGCEDGQACGIDVDCSSKSCTADVCACAPCSSFLTLPEPRRMGVSLCNPDLVGEFFGCACKGPCTNICGMDCQRRGTSGCEACIIEKCANVVEACSRER